MAASFGVVTGTASTGAKCLKVIWQSLHGWVVLVIIISGQLNTSHLFTYSVFVYATDRHMVYSKLGNRHCCTLISSSFPAFADAFSVKTNIGQTSFPIYH